MASLDHPNITKVLDFEDSDEVLAIVMELLEGSDLSDLIKDKGALTFDQFKPLFVQILDAFKYAHNKGIVHRDIKPSNIFIDGQGKVKILDFGIAKLFGQGNEMTQTGTQMGTPAYMSPEQVKGDKSIDHRSDIYALGVTLFYALEGRSPYDTDNESQFDIFNKIVYEELPILSSNSEHATLIQQACQKDRNLRFQKIEDFENALNEEAQIQPKVVYKASVKTVEDKPVQNRVVAEKTILDQATTVSTSNKKSKIFIFIPYLPLILLLGFSLAYFISVGWYMDLYYSYLYNPSGKLETYHYRAMELENFLMGIETLMYVILSNLAWLIIYLKLKIKIHYILRVCKIIFSSLVGVWALLKAIFLSTDYSTTHYEIWVWIPFMLFELFFAILLIVRSRKVVL
jgi:serine/threonine protein kinase